MTRGNASPKRSAASALERRNPGCVWTANRGWPIAGRLVARYLKLHRPVPVAWALGWHRQVKRRRPGVPRARPFRLLVQDHTARSGGRTCERVTRQGRDPAALPAGAQGREARRDASFPRPAAYVRHEDGRCRRRCGRSRAGWAPGHRDDPALRRLCSEHARGGDGRGGIRRPCRR